MSSECLKVDMTECLKVDDWVEILNHLDCPKDYKNAALTCLAAGTASLILKEKKAIEFSQELNHGVSGMVQTKYYILPNQRIHGLYKKIYWLDDYCIETVSEFSFGKFVKDYETNRQKKQIMEFS